MEYLSGFKTYLQNRSYSASTVRNYLSDLNKFFTLCGIPQNTPSLSSQLTPEAISDFLTKTSTDTNSKRYLAALRSFCQYALDQNLIPQSPFKGLSSSTASKDNQISLTALLQQYRSYLASKNKTPATIKNYINDIQNFISWSENIEA